jgi:hypothetical protein
VCAEPTVIASWAVARGDGGDRGAIEADSDGSVGAEALRAPARKARGLQPPWQVQESVMRLFALVSLVSLVGLAPVVHAGAAPAATGKAGAASTERAASTGKAAGAAPTPAQTVQMPPIDLSVVPEACKPLAKQAVAPNGSVAWVARISLASCMADRAVAPIALCDCGASIVAVDAAVAPAIAVLDDVIGAADPATQIAAEHAEGELYAGLVSRLLATLPKVGSGATDAEIALHDMRTQALQVQLAAWREAALTSFQHVVEIAKAHPELANNRAVATAVRDSEQRLSAEVATR